MTNLKVDPETGEVLPQVVMVKSDKAPAIVLDISEVTAFHTNPKALADKIRQQAGYAVFDVTTKQGRDACRSHAANIIKCIAPALKASIALADDAKQVVKQDLAFRKVFEEEVREIAAFHRRPLTEWEEEQERIKEEARLADEKRLAEEQYLKDWQDALDYNELFDLRRQKQIREQEEERLKIEHDIATKKAWARENADGYQFLFSDMNELVRLPFDVFQAKVNERVTTHVKREERIRQEAEEKALAEAEAEKQAEIERVRKEEAEKAKAEQQRMMAEQAEAQRQDNQTALIRQEQATAIVQDVAIEQDQAKQNASRPTRFEFCYAIAKKYDVSKEVAEQWLIDEFSEQAQSNQAA